MKHTNLVADVIIIGGGMVGASAAIGFAQAGKRVIIVEPSIPATVESSQAIDCRISAVSCSSIRLLESLGVWSRVLDMRSQPYNIMSVYENAAAQVDLTAQSINLPELGHMVENQVLQRALYDRCAEFPSVQWISNYFKGVKKSDQGEFDILLDNDQRLSAKLVVAADGARSKVRSALNIGGRGWQYNQHVLGVAINHHGTMPEHQTWQRFTATGPQAYLPMQQQQGCLIWYHHPRRIAELNQLDEQSLKQEIVKCFPPTLGDFSIISSASFPINRFHAHQYFKRNVVLVGDAAHSINPLAGQGLNLGYQDVQALLDIFNDKALETSTVDQGLIQYQQQRRSQNRIMMRAMDGFYSVFSNQNSILKLLRNAALKLASAPIVTRQVLRYALALDKESRHSKINKY